MRKYFVSKVITALFSDSEMLSLKCLCCDVRILTIKKSLQDYFSFCHVNKLRAVQPLSLYENNLSYNPQTILLLLAKKYPCRWWALSWTFSLFCRWPVCRRGTRSSRRWRSLMFFWSWFRWSWCRPRWRHPSCRSWTWCGSPWKQKSHT